MNLPNKLTLMRIILVPVFLLFYYLSPLAAMTTADALNSRAQIMGFLALAVFLIASATDAVDGHIARSRGLVTNFGKLMDPLADKILTTAAFVAFVDTHIIAAWMLVVILAREFAITGLRAVAASEGVVIPAGKTGKFKTVFQMGCIALFLLAGALLPFAAAAPVVQIIGVVAIVCLWAAVVLTVISGIEYLWRGRDILNAK
ncbi:MAG: CDP-diacylglycerol--glycerol-3-phosphate 3-phosphatidyltransferase [Clostridiales bacterium]|nr:CDP-diacylglycerol--glycerol-3-phosphate 3-phosphatidyltransferase [Clostridiales bacterium]